MKSFIRSCVVMALIYIPTSLFSADRPDLDIRISSYTQLLNTIEDIKSLAMPSMAAMPSEPMILGSFGLMKAPDSLDKNKPIFIKAQLPSKNSNKPIFGLYLPVSNFDEFSKDVEVSPQLKNAQLIQSGSYAVITEKTSKKNEQKILQSWKIVDVKTTRGIVNLKLDGDYIKENADEWIVGINALGAMAMTQSKMQINPMLVYSELLKKMKDHTKSIEYYFDYKKQDVSFSFRFNTKNVKHFPSKSNKTEIVDFSKFENQYDFSSMRGKMEFSEGQIKAIKEIYDPFLAMFNDKKESKFVMDTMMTILSDLQDSDMYGTMGYQDNQLASTSVIYKKGADHQKIINTMFEMTKYLPTMKIDGKSLYKNFKSQLKARTFEGIDVHSMSYSIDLSHAALGNKGEAEQFLKMFSNYDMEIASVNDVLIVTLNDKKAMNRALKLCKNFNASKKENLRSTDFVMDIDFMGFYRPILLNLDMFKQNPAMAAMFNIALPIKYTTSYRSYYGGSMSINAETIRNIAMLAMTGFQSFQSMNMPNKQ